MPDNSNTVKITLQFADDGTIKIIDQSKGKIEDLERATVAGAKKAQGEMEGYLKFWTRLTPEIDKAYQKMREGPGRARGPMASLLEDWGKTTSTVAGISKEIDDLGETTEKASAKGTSGLKQLKAGWLELSAGVIAGYLTIKKGIDVITGLVNVAAEAEQIEKRAAFQMETWGYKFQEIKPYVDAFAESIQRTTRFSGEMARQGLGQMMQFTSSIEEGMKGVQIAMDMSTQTGQDLNSTIRLVGMAMSGNVEMLGRWIRELRDLESKLGANASGAEKAVYMFDIFNKKFGGAAQKDLQSYGGQLGQLKNQWDDLKILIGTALMPAAENWVLGTKSIITGLMPSVKKLKNELANLKITEVQGFEGVPLELLPQEALDEYNRKVKDLTDRIKAMESASGAAAEAAKKAAEQAARIPVIDIAPRDPDRWKKWAEEWDGVTYAIEQLGFKSTTVLSKEATDALRYAEVIKKAFQEKKASVSDYINALNVAADAMKKLTGEDDDKTNKLIKNEEEYQKRIRAISPEASDEERRKQVQAAIDDWQTVRKEIEKIAKIPVQADVAPMERQVQESIRKLEAQGITIPVTISGGIASGGGSETSWEDYVKGNTSFFQGGGTSGALMDLTEIENKLEGISDINVDIGIYGTGSTRKPITEKIQEIIDEFGGLEKALQGMEAEINIAELSAEYKKLETKLNQVERILPEMSAIASATGGSPYVGGAIVQTVKDLTAEYTEQMRILQMKMDYQMLRAYGGSYQAGTRYVPQTGLYTLHEGERVLTKNQISVAGSTNNFYIKSTNPRETADEILQVLKYDLHTELKDFLKKR